MGDMFDDPFFHGGSIFGGGRGGGRGGRDRGEGGMPGFGFGGGGIFDHMKEMTKRMDSMFGDMNRHMEPGKFGEMSMDLPKGNGHMQSYSSSYSCVSNGKDAPHIKEFTSQRRVGPGGVAESQQRSSDSKTGMEKMAVQRQIQDRARRAMRQVNRHSGERTEDGTLVNMSEGEQAGFDADWKKKSSALPRGDIGSHMRSLGDVPQMMGGLGHRRGGAQQAISRGSGHDGGRHTGFQALGGGSSHRPAIQMQNTRPRQSNILSRPPTMNTPSAPSSASSHRR